MAPHDSRKKVRNKRKLLLSVAVIGAGAALVNCSNEEDVGIYVSEGGPPQDASGADAEGDASPADAARDVAAPLDAGDDAGNDAGDDAGDE